MKAIINNMLAYWLLLLTLSCLAAAGIYLLWLKDALV
jgi:hypothetical protein